MNLLTCRRVLIAVGWLALAMAGCSTEPPQPSVALTRSEVTPAAALQAMSAEPLKKCPECKKPKYRRLFGAGAALVFKGSGFYRTDSRSKPTQPSP